MSLTDWRILHGDAFAGRKICVTGGAGFIGSHLTEALVSLGAAVVVLDDLSGGDTANLAGFDDGIKFIEGSITEPQTVADAVAGCELVYHQAALGSVPRSVEQPERYHDVNSTGTFHVLEAARIAEVRRVIFAASSSAYGDSPTLPKIETMPVLPKSPYAANKIACEALMRAYANSYEIDTASLRYFNIFGPRQNANSAYAAVIAAFAKSLIAGQPPTIFGDGEQSRDFTFVDNAVHANLLAGRNDQPICGEVFNVACGDRITVNELALAMASLMGRAKTAPEHKPERTGDVKHSLADLSKARQTLGYEPIVPFNKGLESTVQWYTSAI